jgi:hypothetical protein
MGDGVLIYFGYRKLTRLLSRDLSVPADRHTLVDTITIPVVDEIGLSMFEAETHDHFGAH